MLQDAFSAHFYNSGMLTTARQNSALTRHNFCRWHQHNGPDLKQWRGVQNGYREHNIVSWQKHLPEYQQNEGDSWRLQVVGGLHATVCINGTEGEVVKIFKFLSVNIANLFRSSHINAMVKKTHQWLFPQTTKGIRHVFNFGGCTVESILSGCITTWFANCSAKTRSNCRKPYRKRQKSYKDKIFFTFSQEAITDISFQGAESAFRTRMRNSERWTKGKEMLKNSNDCNRTGKVLYFLTYYMERDKK